MITRISRTLGLVLATGALLCGQQGKLAGPVAGFVFDGASRSLRPIQGIAGASLLGDPMNLGFDVTSAYVAPAQDSAIVVGGDGSLHYFRLTPAGPAETALNGISGVPGRVVFSPAGTAAALINSGKAQVLKGLPSAPVLAGSIDLTLPRGVVTTTASAPPARRVTAEAMALSDDGTYLLHVAGGSMWLLSIHGENRRVMNTEADGLVAFSVGTHDAAVLDRMGLAVVHDAPGAASREVLGPLDESLASPVGLAFSRDGRNLFVASSAARSVVAYDLTAATHTSIGCDCTPAALIRMGDLFRLNELGSAPLWLLDLGTAGPRTVFVPARVE